MKPRPPAGDETVPAESPAGEPSISPRAVARRVASNTGFAILDLVVSKLGNTLAFVLLVRLLDAPDIAAIGIASGYLVFISYLDVSPVRALLRDYPRFARDRVARNRLFTGLAGFWALQAACMVALWALLAGTALRGLPFEGLRFLFLGLTVDFIALTLQDWAKLVHYADFRQRFATGLSLVLNVARLGVYLLLLLDPSLELYTWLLIGTATSIGLAWGVAFQRRYRFRPRLERASLHELIRSLRSYGLWDHLNRSATDTLFLVDTVVLSALGLLASLDAYTIALKFTSMLFLLTFQLERGLQLALSNYAERSLRIRAIEGFLKLNGLVSLAQLAAVALFGGWILRVLFGEAVDAATVRFTLVITLGVTIHNLARPLVAVVNNLCSLRDAFLQAFLPAVVAGLGVYVLFALAWGTPGVAWANVVVYALLSGALVLFVARRYAFRPRLRLLTREERTVLSDLLRGVRSRP